RPPTNGAQSAMRLCTAHSVWSMAWPPRIGPRSSLGRRIQHHVAPARGPVVARSISQRIPSQVAERAQRRRQVLAAITDHTDRRRSRDMTRRRRTWLVAGATALLVVVGAGAYLYLTVFAGSAPAEVSLSQPSASTAASGGTFDGTFDGTWTVDATS